MRLSPGFSARAQRARFSRFCAAQDIAPHEQAEDAGDRARPIPKRPTGLGPDGQAAWKWVWSPQHTWITSRHLGLVERYCRLRDVMALTLEQVSEDGIMVTGRDSGSMSRIFGDGFLEARHMFDREFARAVRVSVKDALQQLDKFGNV